MSAFNDPGKLEEAMRVVAATASLSIYSGDAPATSVSINTGMDDGDADLPLVTCAILGGSEEWVRGTGNLQSTVVVRMTSSALVTLAEHRARAAAVFDRFMQTDIAATLAAAVSDFHVFQVRPQTPEPTRRDPREGDSFVWVSELGLEVLWCGTDIA